MAISIQTDFEVRQTGDDSNGGGWETDSGGTDYSQQDSPQITVDGATITATVHTTTTQLNIVGYTVQNPGDLGNCFNITGGSVSAQLRQITAVDTVNNRWTMDASVGTAGQTATGRVGGAMKSPGRALQFHVGGNRIYIKYSATSYDITTTSSNVANGKLLPTTSDTGRLTRIKGYDVTREDYTSNMPTIKATVGSINMIETTGTGNGVLIQNLILDGNAQTSIQGLRMVSSASGRAYRVRAKNCSTAGFVILGTNHVINCEAIDNTNRGFLSSGAKLVGCYAKNNTNANYEEESDGTYLFCIADDAAAGGVAGHGFYVTTVGNGGVLYANCLAYNNTADGFHFLTSREANTLVNCIIYGNDGNGIEHASGVYARIILLQCAFGDNTGGDFAAGSGDDAFELDGANISLSADPFTDAANKDFTLNNTAGGGALLREAGFPGTILGTTGEGFMDLGPLQVENASSNACFVLSQTTSVFSAVRGAVGY